MCGVVRCLSVDCGPASPTLDQVAPSRRKNTECDHQGLTFVGVVPIFVQKRLPLVPCKIVLQWSASGTHPGS